MAMKVTVDHDLCEGHSRCQSAAPEVFEVRNDDKSYVLMEPVPEELRDKVERAARLCPRQAITVEEAG
jgi:ferredoxin